mgnify:CR=1 FL=1
MSEMAEENLVLIDDEGNEHEFEIVDIMEVEGNRYVIMLPLGEELLEEEEAVVMKIILDEEGEEVFADIESDEEWDKVEKAYAEMLWEDEE